VKATKYLIEYLLLQPRSAQNSGSLSGCPYRDKHTCSCRPTHKQKNLDQSRNLSSFSSLLWLTNLCLGLSVISFRSSTLRQVSCYTFLSGFQPSWPPTCYLQHTTSFVVSDEPPSLGTVSKLSVHPASPALLTSDGPLRAPIHSFISHSLCSVKKKHRVRVQLRSLRKGRDRQAIPKSLLYIALPDTTGERYSDNGL